MMADPGIILFGKKITSFAPPAHGGADHGFMVDREDSTTEKDQRKDEDKPEDDPKTPPIDEGSLEEPPATGAEGNTADLNPKTLKKPDKILPCPRCESMNTKFCYYNNSNMKQPRHFCKSCQRYWTAGGTMRNMPVGAGRRKKKNPPPHCRYIVTREVCDLAQKEVISFGPNSPQFGSSLSVVSSTGRENRDDCSSESTVITSNSVMEKSQDFNGFHSKVHWIPGASWTYNNPWNAVIPMPIPAIYPPIYSSPYWNSVPWLPPVTSSPNFSILGKHLTDGESVKQSGSDEEPKKQKNEILVPKTLRIDDPDEAAKSSIWATLGIKNENSGRGLFKAFEAKRGEKKKHPAMEPSPVLQANPAAFSRSLCFQERA